MPDRLRATKKGTGSSPVLISPVVSFFTRMTDTWQVKDPRAKKTHSSFFLQHLFPRQFQIFYPFVLLSHLILLFVVPRPSLSIIKIIAWALLSVPFSSTKLLSLSLQICHYFLLLFLWMGWVLRDFGSNGDESVVWASHSWWVFKDFKDFDVALILMTEKIWFWVLIMLMAVDGFY